MNHDVSCIAWWYLQSLSRYQQWFVAVFVNSRQEFFIRTASGAIDLPPKHDHEPITKPGWRFDQNTRRIVLARVLKYAQVFVDTSVAKRSVFVRAHSYSEDTGTSDDACMREWEQQHGSCSPMWWPDTAFTSWQSEKPEVRVGVDEEGFNLEELIKGARKPRRRKQMHNGKVVQRIGRFFVYAKDEDAPY